MLDDEKGSAPAGTNGEGTKAAFSGRQTEIATLRAVLEPLFTAYVAAGHELIPLNVPDAQDRKGRPIGKAPKFKNWRTAPALSVEEALDWRGLDGNVGVRLRPTDLVVDVDPRNFLPGDDPLARLEKDAGIALREICPTVVTGSGGLHLYLRKPDGFEVRDSLEEYQGVEFKTVGRQVVAPGSVHPCGGVYALTIDDDVLSLSVPIDRAPDAPDRLLGMIRRPDTYQGDAEAGDVEPERLAELLDVLDPTEFKDQQRWLEMMMACHHATAGEGREEFIAWSTSDPVYVDHGWIIGRRWDSLDSKKPGHKVTVGTLYKALKDAGRGDLIPAPERASAQEDFAGEEVDLDAVVELDASRERHFVDEMNDTFCAVLEGGKFRVFMEDTDYTFGTPRRVFVRMERQSFLHFHENNRVMTPDGPGKSKAELWLKAPKRRTYKGIVMAPEGARAGVLNLWRGWAVPPKAGDWAKTRTFIYDLLASGNQEAGDYILKWMAFMVQKPHILPQVALVFRGLKGTGKGTLGKALLNIAGTHGLTVASTEQFAGRFDAHLRDCVFLFADEALWAGDKQAEGKLKQLITEPSKAYEAKGVDVSMGRNITHVMMASNSDWVVPASADERRYAVFDVSDARKQDRSYFGPIDHELYREGGLEAMLHDLLSMDLGDWVPYGNVPRTEGSAAQKVLSLEGMSQWWFKALQSGDPSTIGFPGQDWSKDLTARAGEGKGSVLTSLEAEYPRKRFSLKALAQFLKSVGVDIKTQDKRGNRVWLVPPLDQARQAFADWMNEDLTWED